MKPISEIEYVELIDENETSKVKFTSIQVNKLKESFTELMNNQKVEKHLLKQESPSSILLNLNKDSVELDKFKSSFLVAINTTNYSYHYNFKTFKSIVENLNDLIQHSLTKTKKK
jgi:hypothetical protein